jgi:hypothetical protein
VGDILYLDICCFKRPLLKPAQTHQARLRVQVLKPDQLSLANEGDSE